ncbi:MAG: Ig-like domain-containing protein, partial [Eubacterium sp.]|nr:Ig-like domain-containing protein [Eubacterium sp.]
PGTATPVGNYTVTAANGTLEIIQATVAVTISGHYNTSVFDGGEHSISGYDFASTNPLYTESYFTFSGNALAKRTDFGKTNMGLLDSQFLNTNNNFSVTFIVTDGYQQIIAKQINDSFDVTLDSTVYDGAAKQLAVKLGDKVLASGADYSVSIKNAEGAAVSEIIGAGEYTVTVTGKGNYTGSVTKTVTVAPAKITVTAEDKESNHGTDLLALTYKIGGNYVDGDELGITLNADIDNTKPGAYPITPSWNNNSNYTATLVDGTYTVGDEPHYYGTQGDERFTCTVCGEVDETLKAQAEAADKEAADTAAAKAVTDMINALPEKEEITTADEAAIKKAREAYDSLTDDQKAKVAPETVNKLTEAEKALAEEKAEEATAAQEKAKAEFIAGVDGTSTDSSIIVKWGKVNGAKRYVIYAAYCDKNHKYKYKKIKTVSGKVTKYEIKKLYGKKLNPKRNVKVYIVAQKKKNGKWKKIFKTPTFHIAGAQSKCSNVKKITVKKAKFSLKKGKTAKIKAKLVLVDRNKKAVNHVRKLRYKSTNTAVVKVTKSGKIKAVGKGTATVFVYSNNGTAKAIKVTVK